MSDSMQGGQPDARQAMEQNRSLLNPTDAAAMAQQGKIRGDMSVRELFANLGIDVDGPATQLIKFSQKQMENAKMGKKMQSMAAARPAPEPPAGGPAQGGPPPGGGGPAPGGGGGLEELIRMQGGGR